MVQRKSSCRTRLKPTVGLIEAIVHLLCVNGNKIDAHENNSTGAISQQRGNQHGNESAVS
jgi:hypothetical protein